MQRAIGHAACEKSSIAAEVYRETGGRPLVTPGFIAGFLDAMHRELAIQGNPEISAGPVESERDRGGRRRRERVDLFASRRTTASRLFRRRSRAFRRSGENASACVGVGAGFQRLISLAGRAVPQRDRAVLARGREHIRARLPRERSACLTSVRRSPRASSESAVRRARAPPCLRRRRSRTTCRRATTRSRRRSRRNCADARGSSANDRDCLAAMAYFATADSKPASSSARSRPRPMNTRLFMRGAAPHGPLGLRVEHHVHAVEHLAAILALDVEHALHAEDVLRRASSADSRATG